MISAPSVSGWLEPVPQIIQWLREMKTIFVEHEANVKCCFVHTGCVSTIVSSLQNHTSNWWLTNIIKRYYMNFQIWYEVIRDIPAGHELLLASKVPLNLRDMFYDNSDKETGKWKTWISSERIHFGRAKTL